MFDLFCKKIRNHKIVVSMKRKKKNNTKLFILIIVQ